MNKKQTASVIMYSFIFFAFIGICLIQVHEFQHYNDAKDLGCENISYQVIRVQAQCPINVTKKVLEMNDYRDQQFLSLWGILK